MSLFVAGAVMAISTKSSCRLEYIVSLSVFFMFALSLSVPSGYSIGPSFLLMLSILLFIPKKIWQNKCNFNTDMRDVWLTLAFAAYFMVLVTEVLWFGLKSREIDKPARFLLSIPVLFILLHCSPRITWLWKGIIVGAVSAGIIAIYQKIWQGSDRASGFIYPIQFGDLSMLMGVLCLAGIAWGQEQKHRAYWIITFALGASMGIIASLLSGSRGGWIGAPLIFIMLVKNYSHFLSRAQWIGLITGILMCASAVIAIPETGVSSRAIHILYDLRLYAEGNGATSLGARFDLWRMSNYMFGHRPVFGYGSYGFVEMLPQLVDKFGYGHAVVAENLQSAHNEILDAAAKRGSIGVLALLGVYLIPLALFSRYRKSRDMTTRSLALGGAMIPLCFIDFGMSQVLFTHNDAVMVYPYAIAVFWACLRYRQAQLRWTNSGFLPPSK